MTRTRHSSPVSPTPMGWRPTTLASHTPASPTMWHHQWQQLVRQRRQPQQPLRPHESGGSTRGLAPLLGRVHGVHAERGLSRRQCADLAQRPTLREQAQPLCALQRTSATTQRAWPMSNPTRSSLRIWRPTTCPISSGSPRISATTCMAASLCRSRLTGSDGTPCPFGSTKDDPNDAALKQKADALVHDAVTAIMSSKAWRGNSAIFVVDDENDFTGNPATDGWESAAGCCDSPLLPNGYQFLTSGGTPDGKVWLCPFGANPACQYGGGLIPAIVVTRHGPRGFVSNQPYNHYSLLRTIEENWGLPYLGNASDSPRSTRWTSSWGIRC